jgi:hypothetical protein
MLRFPETMIINWNPIIIFFGGVFYGLMFHNGLGKKSLKRSDIIPLGGFLR